LIVLEDLNVEGLSSGMLSKAVHDVSWTSFINITLDRDHAAAFIILGRGLRLHAETKPEVRACVAWEAPPFREGRKQPQPPSL